MLNALAVLCVLSADPIALSFASPLKPVEQYRVEDGGGCFDLSDFNWQRHLGEDRNRIPQGNETGEIDFGDPVYCIGEGIVEDVNQGTVPSWGKVLVIRHRLIDGRAVWSVYAHLKDIWVEDGEGVHKGQEICTIGNANGVYPAHLHFALMSKGPFPPYVPAYEVTLTTENTKNYLIPSLFIESRLDDNLKGFVIPESWVRIPLQYQAPTVTAYVEVDGRIYSLSQAVQAGRLKMRGKPGGLKWINIDDPREVYFPVKGEGLKVEVRAKKAGTKLAVFPLNLNEGEIEMTVKMDVLTAARDLAGQFNVRSFEFEKLVSVPVSENVGGVFFEGYLSFLKIKTGDRYLNGVYHFYNTDNPLARVVSFTSNDIISYQWFGSPLSVY